MGAVLTISKAIKTEPASSQTPTLEITMQHIEPASRADQHVLRAKVSATPPCVLSRFRLRLLNWFQVALREQYRCAITKVFDSARAENLIEEGRVEEVPENVGQHLMDAAHIIPFLLNKFNDKTVSNPEIVRDLLLLSPLRYIFVDRQTPLGPGICFGLGRESTLKLS